MDARRMKDEPDFIAQELARLGREIERAQHAADGAMGVANGAKSDIAAHEKLCALRYETITTKLTAVPKIEEKINEMMKMLYIGVGVWVATLGLSVVVGIVYTVFKFAHGG
jgi:hypothetical protein